MKTRVTKSPARTANDECAKLVRRANNNPRRFGEEIIKAMKQKGLRLDDLAQAFSSANLEPSDARYLSRWLNALNYPYWTAKHLHVLLNTLEKDASYFVDILKGEKNERAPVMIGVNDTDALQPKPRDIAIDVAMLQKIALQMVDKTACLRRLRHLLKTQQITFAMLAGAFACQGLKPDDEAGCRLLLEGTSSYPLGYVHHYLIAEMLGMTMEDYSAKIESDMATLSTVVVLPLAKEPSVRKPILGDSREVRVMRHRTPWSET